MKYMSIDGRDVEVFPLLKFTHYGGNPIPYANSRFSLDESAQIFDLERNV